ncbi:unnamed protein product, partial [Scytosiphon promiscuus]
LHRRARPSERKRQKEILPEGCGFSASCCYCGYSYCCCCSREPASERGRGRYTHSVPHVLLHDNNRRATGVGCSIYRRAKDETRQ